MDIKEVKELISAFDASNSSYLSLEVDGTKVKLKKPSDKVTGVSPSEVRQVVAKAPVTLTNETSAPADKADEEPEGEKVLSPLVGVFYAAPSPEAAAYVQVGDKVKKGEILCLIEAMKMMSEITAPKDGVVKKIYVKNQDVVGFEEPLFLLGD